MLTSSIALCTYNGIRFIKEQLDSLANQTLPPDEIVICDDGSNDGTREFLEEYSRSSQLPISLHFNDHNLGYCRNFEKCASLCSREVVFFCDQDDIWVPEKIETFMKEFEDEQIGLVLSEADLIDSSGTARGILLSESWGLDGRKCKPLLEGNAINFVLQYSNWVGMSMAYRNTFSKYLFPYLQTKGHDLWTLRIVGSIAKARFILQPMVHYRIHGKNTFGTDLCKRSIFNSFEYARRPECTEVNIQYAEEFEEVLERLSEFPDIFPSKVLEEYRGKRLHHLNRYLLRTRKINKWLGILRETLTGRYFRYGKGIKNIGMDVLS